MRSLVRLVLAAVVVATGLVLSACSSLPDSLDPTEWFDTKKKLTGERRDVFPEGVPGVTRGIPPELVKGYREPEGGGTDPAKEAAEAAAGTPAKKPPQRTASKPKPKPADATATPTSASDQQPAPPPWPGSR